MSNSSTWAIVVPPGVEVLAAEYHDAAAGTAAPRRSHRAAKRRLGSRSPSFSGFAGSARRRPSWSCLARPARRNARRRPRRSCGCGRPGKLGRAPPAPRYGSRTPRASGASRTSSAPPATYSRSPITAAACAPAACPTTAAAASDSRSGSYSSRAAVGSDQAGARVAAVYVQPSRCTVAVEWFRPRGIARTRDQRLRRMS